jgi:hypothetical protein
MAQKQAPKHPSDVFEAALNFLLSDCNLHLLDSGIKTNIGNQGKYPQRACARRSDERCSWREPDQSSSDGVNRMGLHGNGPVCSCGGCVHRRAAVLVHHGLLPLLRGSLWTANCPESGVDLSGGFRQVCRKRPLQAHQSGRSAGTTSKDGPRHSCDPASPRV